MKSIISEASAARQADGQNNYEIDPQWLGKSLP